MGKKKDAKAAKAVEDVFSSEESPLSVDLRTALRARTAAGEVLSPPDVDADGTPGFEGNKAEGRAALSARSARLAELQELLYAAGRVDQEAAPSVLVVVQGMDTAGKGGLMRTVAGAMDPQGVRTAAFGRPTEEELEHDFLWRIEQQMPEPGQIVVFDRSHYEDVLVHRVEGLSPRAEVDRRYGAIREFEEAAVAAGTRVVKVMLHISKQEQGERLLARLENPDKHWKYDPADLDTRAKWDEYQQAYAIAIVETDSDRAPWYIVPADRKWYSRLAVQEILIAELEDLDLRWPASTIDAEAEKARLAAL